MAIAFTTDEKVTIERAVGPADPDYGSEPAVEVWEVVASRIWANVQDVLPSRAEATQNGIRLGTQQARLRIRNNSAITALMRVTLHGKGERVMQIIAGPSLLDDRVHTEFMLESYSS